MNELIRRINLAVQKYVNDTGKYPNVLLLGRAQWMTFGEAFVKGYFGAVDEQAICDDNVYYAQMRVLHTNREDQVSVGTITEV